MSRDLGHAAASQDPFRLDGYACLVTGGGSGIGRATALALAEAGCARLFLVGRRGDKLAETATAIAKINGRCDVLTLAGDVAATDIRLAIKALVARHGDRLDALINNAGYFDSHSLSDTTDAAWHRHLEVNLTAPFALARELLPALKRGAQPSIVNISSTLAAKPIPQTAAYNAAKAGLVQLTRTLALELGPQNVRVNAVLPAIVETPMYRGRYADDATYTEGMRAAATLHPLGRVGQPLDVALAIRFLISPAAGWITGISLPVDGGMLCT